MERAWFEIQRRRISRLQIATIVMMCVFFAFYFLGRTTLDEIVVWGPHSPRGIAAAARLAYLGPLTWVSFSAFIAAGTTRQVLLSRYNKQILARDPMLLDEFIPLVR